MKKVCVMCGKEFETYKSNQKTCSLECRQKKDYEYNRRNTSKLDKAIYNFRAAAKAKGLFWAGDC